MDGQNPISPTVEQEPSLPVSSPCFDNPRQKQRASLPARPNVAARHSKRLTLNFPINVPPPVSKEASSLEQESPALDTMSPLARSSRMSSPSRISAAAEAVLDTADDDGSEFLTALAAQERKVLELKEELHKAESDLQALKFQWQLSEKGRKKTEIVHQAETMKPIRQSHGSISSRTSVDEAAAGKARPADSPRSSIHGGINRGLERRNSARHSASQSISINGASQNSKGRTVFQGSHTRTLSLLSSSGLGNPATPSFPQPSDVNDVRNSTNDRVPRHPRSATLPSLDREENGGFQPPYNPLKARVQDNKTAWRRSLPPIPQDATADVLVRTGKQMATDFKDGLWTFLEDIRQATVGEEGINGTESRSVQAQYLKSQGTGTSLSRERSTGSRNSRSTASNSIMATRPGRSAAAPDISFWNEYGIDAPDPASEASNAAKSKKAANSNTKEEANLLDIDDSWDVWDSPQPAKTHTPSSSSSTFPSKRDDSPSTSASSPRTSARSVAQGPSNPLNLGPFG